MLSKGRLDGPHRRARRWGPTRDARFQKKRPGPSGGPWRGPSPQTISDYATAETGSAGRQEKRAAAPLNIQREVLLLYCPPMNATRLRRSPLRMASAPQPDGHAPFTQPRCPARGTTKSNTIAQVPVVLEANTSGAPAAGASKPGAKLWRVTPACLGTRRIFRCSGVRQRTACGSRT